MANNSTINTSNASLIYDSWTFLPCFSLAVLLAGILTNCIVLYQFIRCPNLRTSFTVYLINLLTANLITQLIQVPIYLVANLRSYWWIGRTACSIYIYGYFHMSIMCNAHALISLNRLWAVCWPISYRRYHTKRTAWLICGSMWVYVHILTFPGWIMDVLYYRLPEEQYGCFLNKAPQMAWAYLHQFVVFDGPVVVIFVTFPIISYKIWRRRQFRRGIAPKAVSSKRRSSSKITTEQAIIEEGIPSIDGAADSIPMSNQIVQGQLPPVVAEKTNYSFLILLAVTCAVLMFWVPSLTYYTVVMFSAKDWDMFQVIGTVLWFAELVVDPILFTLILRDLREAVRGFLGLC